MKRCGLLFLVSSLLALGAAYVAEMFFGLVPCKLCLYERVPYFVVILPAVLMIARGYGKMFYVAVACYVVGVTISGYHAGLEYGWFTDILQCAGDLASSGASFTDLKAALLSKVTVVSCSVPSFVFMGISLSGWNAIYLVVCLIWAFILRKRWLQSTE
ncbi:MAG: disulfide bond formation protein B [Aaplasma endosymbiont of Hyalomma asiaticum]